jgi:hypothetical protein
MAVHHVSAQKITRDLQGGTIKKGRRERLHGTT